MNVHPYSEYSLSSIQMLCDVAIRQPKTPYNDQKICDLRQALKTKKLECLSIIKRIESIENELTQGIMRSRKLAKTLDSVGVTWDYRVNKGRL